MLNLLCLIPITCQIQKNYYGAKDFKHIIQQNYKVNLRTALGTVNYRFTWGNAPQLTKDRMLEVYEQKEDVYATVNVKSSS